MYICMSLPARPPRCAAYCCLSDWLAGWVQGVMLEELDRDVDTTQSRLKAAQKRMADIIRKSGSNTQLALIGALIVILIVLSIFAFM